jgi:hypothetical protein
MKVEKQLKELEHNEQRLSEQRAEILDQYATGKLDRKDYLKKCLWLDNQLQKLQRERSDQIQRIPALHKKEVIDVSLRIFCETARARFERCDSFDTKRQFCLDFIEEILYDHGKVTVKGFVPIKLQAYIDPDQTSDASKIEFSIQNCS